MTTRSKARVYRRDPRPLKQGACTVCFRVVAINSTGLRRQHVDDEGQRCTGSGVRVEVAAVTAEMLSEARIVLSPRCSDRPRPIGACHECARQITGERLYCGPCMSRRRL